MNIWLISREYAQVAEAGGVKNVACSLSENLVKAGHSVTVFIPRYGCTNTGILSFKESDAPHSLSVSVADKNVEVSYERAKLNGVQFILVSAPDFLEKNSIYTYTRQDEEKNPAHKQGEGFDDALLLDILFQKAVALYAVVAPLKDKPEIIHCQDAAAAMVPAFAVNLSRNDEGVKSFYSKARFITTIHNAGPGYHHDFRNIDQAQYFTKISKTILQKGLCQERIEPFLLASCFGLITAVSPQYAGEILQDQTETQGLGLCFRQNNVRLYGICNGIDFFRYNPSNRETSLLPFEFNPATKNLEGKYECRKHFLENYCSRDTQEANARLSVEQKGYIEGWGESTVFITYHGRVVHQKGIDVLEKAARRLLEKSADVRFLLSGQGFPELEQLMENLALDFPGKAVYLKGYDKMLSRLCVASADFSLHPSWFEPCGLEDFIAQIYGTIPVANATGGLCKIRDDETGFLYTPNTPEKLESTLSSLIKIHECTGPGFFIPMISYACRNVRDNYSWENVVKGQYIPLYKKALAEKSPLL